MPIKFVKLLLIEDDEDDAFLIKEFLSDIENFESEIDWVSDPEEGKTKILNGDYHLFLIDFYLGKETGLGLMDFIKKNEILTPAILLTGRNDAQIDIDASVAGAFDYLVKGELTPEILQRSIRYSIKQSITIKELDKKEKRYRSLFERSFDSIFLANERFEMLELNAAFFSFFGYGEHELEGISLRDLFAEQEEYEYCLDQLQRYEVIKDFEVPMLTKTGDLKICLFNCIFIPDQGDENCCYQGIIRDLTLWKKAELDMMVAEKLSMTGKLARTIAHEIRNPLTNLNLALDNIKEEMADENELVTVYSDIIQRSSNRIEKLMGDLLSSSKPKELQLELCSLDDIIDEIIALVRDRANLKGIKLELDLKDDAPRLFVDREKLSIALVNILINGIEAIDHDNGKLSISMIHSKKSIVLEMADNGKGISKEDVKRIFDPFYTDKSDGTGLGLTSTLNILSSHNAGIQVRSVVGEGTTFEVEFPLPEM